MTELSPSARRVQDALTERGYTNQVVEHTQTTRSAKEAAAAIGCAVGQIAKSLIFRGAATHQAVLIIASGSNRVNEQRVAAVLGENIERADPDFVQAVTGFAIGGIPPIGHKTRLTTLIDQDLNQYTEIWAAAGNPNAVYRLTPAELLEMTGGQVVSIQ
jgi:Cys-tRNA(Pro) deacylase